MKPTGIVRKVDELGRIVLPMEMRRVLNISEKEALEIFADRSQIVIKKYEPVCIFCGTKENLAEFKEKTICESCASELKTVQLISRPKYRS